MAELEPTNGREPSLANALERVLETSQRVLLDRLELLRIAIVEDLFLTLRGIATLSAGAALAFGSWFFLMAAVVRWLDEQLPLSASLVIVGVFNAAIGGLLILAGMRAIARVGATGRSAASAVVRVDTRGEGIVGR
ncbi:MAG: hypothetical protein QOD06_2424 [Candidatus Binatota bacterium]|nr:hypothetical protein [Candidatus Binatota bacterium]